MERLRLCTDRFIGYYLIHSTRLGAIFWTYDPETALTRGIFLYYSREVMLSIFKNGLVDCQNWLRSPHAISLLSASYLIRKIDDLRIEQRELLGVVEMETGYHEYEPEVVWDRIARGIAGHQDTTTDFGKLSGKMSGCAATLARLEMTLEIVEKFLRTIHEPLKLSDHNTSGSDENAAEFGAKEVTDGATFLLTYGEYQLSDVRYLQKRVQIQLTAASASIGFMLIANHV